MRLKSRSLLTAGIALGSVWLTGTALVDRVLAQAGQPAAAAKTQTAGEFFKNVTTSTLKGLTPSDFLGAMGVMAAAVGYDCSNCHPGAGHDNVDWGTDRLPQKKTARRMIEMVAT